MPATAALTTTTTRTTGTAVATGQGFGPIHRLQVAFRRVTWPAGSGAASQATAATGTDVTEWVDVTSAVRTMTYDRGRNFELDQFQAGTLAAVLSTNDGRFSPANTTGPYFGYLIPMRPVRWVVEWEGVTYSRFRGFVESWEPSTRADGRDLITTLRATDAFKAARYAEVSGTFAPALTGTRVAALVGGIPGVDVRTTGTGTQVQQQETYTNADPVSKAQEAAFAENGLVYCDGDGAIRFDDRNYRLINEQTPRITFGVAAGEEPYTNPVYVYTDEQIYTETRLTAEGGTEQVSENAAAKSAYGRRVLSGTLNVQVSVGDSTPDNAWAATYGNYLLNRFSQPTIRLTELTCSPYATSTLWPKVIATTLGSRLMVRRVESFSGSPVTVSQPVFVERISETLQPAGDRWSVRFGFSNANADAYWVLGVAGLSELGSTTRLGV